MRGGPWASMFAVSKVKLPGFLVDSRTRTEFSCLPSPSAYIQFSVMVFRRATRPPAPFQCFQANNLDGPGAG